MADLKTFVKRMEELGKEIEVGVDRVVAETAKVISSSVIIATPVDTGRARANWQIGLGASVKNAIEDNDKGGQNTISRNNSAISGRRDDRPVYISNNLDYISALNDGSSAQAPANFVQEAAQKGVIALAKAKVLKK